MAIRPSIMVLPTNVRYSLLDAFGPQVLDRILAVHQKMVRKSRSATIRLTSSGIERSMNAAPPPDGRGQSKFRSHERRSQGRIDITWHDHEIGVEFDQERLQPRHYSRRLQPVGARSNAKHVVGLRHLELLHQQPGHRPIVVLAGVDDVMVRVWKARAQPRHDRGHLDESWGGAPARPVDSFMGSDVRRPRGA